MRLSILAVLIMLATSAFAAELFRYRGAAQDGGALETPDAQLFFVVILPNGAVLEPSVARRL